MIQQNPFFDYQNELQQTAFLDRKNTLIKPIRIILFLVSKSSLTHPVLDNKNSTKIDLHFWIKQDLTSIKSHF